MTMWQIVLSQMVDLVDVIPRCLGMMLEKCVNLQVLVYVHEMKYIMDMELVQGVVMMHV